MKVSLLAPVLASAVLLLNAAAPLDAADDIQPVLMVISNQDFWYQDYADVRNALRAEGLEVVVAAANSNRSRSDVVAVPGLALRDAKAEDYSAIVFVGGWGMAQYQYGFEGTYHNSAYEDRPAAFAANELINDFVQQQKYVGAVCYGVSVLAYARVDGESPLRGLTVTGWNGSAPGFDLLGRSYPDGTFAARRQVRSQGARMPLSGAVGEPQTVEDDVIVDGNIITAENYDSAYTFARRMAIALVQDD